MMSSIRLVLLLLAVKFSPIYGNAFFNDRNDDTTHTTSPLRIEIQPDCDYPNYSEWMVSQKGVLGEIAKGSLRGCQYLYEIKLPLDPSGCYFFELTHDDDDTTTFPMGGFYNIFFDENIIGAGDALSGAFESIQFGNGCASPSSQTTNSKRITLAETQTGAPHLPTFIPTISLYPTITHPR